MGKPKYRSRSFSFFLPLNCPILSRDKDVSILATFISGNRGDEKQPFSFLFVEQAAQYKGESVVRSDGDHMGGSIWYHIELSKALDSDMSTLSDANYINLCIVSVSFCIE